MNFKYIPIEDISQLNKYDKEILRIVKRNDNKAQRLLAKNLWKILKQDLSMVKLQDFPKSYCIKVTDSFLAKKFSFGVMINKIGLNQVEFKLNIKQSVFDEFLDSHQDLMNYLNSVLEKMFSDFLLFE